MKKLILAAAVIVFASFTSYTKNNITRLTATVKVESLKDANKDLALGYPHHSRLDIGQADGNN